MVAAVEDRLILRNDRTKDLRDGIVRGCVPRYGDTATRCLGL